MGLNHANHDVRVKDSSISIENAGIIAPNIRSVAL